MRWTGNLSAELIKRFTLPGQLMSSANPTDSRIAHFLLEGIVDTVSKFSKDQSNALITVIGPTATALLTIYVVLWGAAVASGRVQETFSDGARRILRMCTIVCFALTVGVYQGIVIDFFLSVPNALAVAVSGVSNGMDDQQFTIATSLDASLQKGIDVGARVWEYGDEQGTFSGVGYYFLAIAIFLAVVGIVGYASGIIFVAFMATAVLLAIGPMFILLAIFPATQRFFESWLGQVCNYAVLLVIVTCSVSLCFTVFDSFIDILPKDSWEENLINALKVVGASIAIVAVLMQAYGIAAALGGGAALSAQGMASRALNAGKALANGAAGVGRAAMTGNSRSTNASERSLRQSEGYRRSLSETLALRNSVPATMSYARRVFRPER